MSRFSSLPESCCLESKKCVTKLILTPTSCPVVQKGHMLDSGQLLSFKAERDAACPQLAMRSENAQDPYQWVVGVVTTILIVVMYLAMWILYHYQRKGSDQYGQNRQMQRDQSVETRRSETKKAKEAAQQKWKSQQKSTKTRGEKSKKSKKSEKIRQI